MTSDPVIAQASSAGSSDQGIRPARSLRGMALAGIVVLILLIVIVVNGIGSRRSNAAVLKERADVQSIPTVRVTSPGKGGALSTLDLPARLEAFSRAPIYARVSGYLKSWTVDIGAVVKSGQLLAEIETPDLDQQLLQARADLASTQTLANLSAATARRWQTLVDRDAVSRQDADEKISDAATKQAVLNSAQANVDRMLALKAFTRIVAPFDGLVTARSTDVGALINAGAGVGPELFVVSDIRRLRLYVSVPQSYASLVKVGNRARVSVPDHPGVAYPATVVSSAGAVTPGSGGVLIQLAVNNPHGELLPGGFASVSLELAASTATLTISPSALIFDSGGLHVATVGPGDKVIIKAVTIGRDLGKTIEIASGISIDDRIIESPPEGLSEGDQVRLAGAATAGAPRAERGHD